jgi:light-regulated signal transduction histidine kinase (bacteriophytochrome)
MVGSLLNRERVLGDKVHGVIDSGPLRPFQTLKAFPLGVLGSPAEFCYCDANALLVAAIRSLGRVIPRSGVCVSNDDLPAMYCNPQELVYVFANLIDNAIKFRSEAAPQIRISVTTRGGDWLFSVRDNGIGIDPRRRESVFHTFKRSNGDRCFGSAGSLAVARGIIERHGGTMWVESKPLSGSTFFFTLPVGDSHGPARQVTLLQSSCTD